MRKALVTLFSVGLLGAVLIPSCVVKDDGDGGNEGKGGSGAGDSGGSSATGGKGSLGSGGDSSSGGEGGASTPTTSVADACPDLKFTSETGEACTAMNMSATYKDIHMLVVLDKSGSMDNIPEGFGKSKWAATKEALAAALESSTDKVRYGLLMYPYSLGSAIPAKDCGTRCCELPQPVDAINVPVGSAKDTVPAIVELLNSTAPGGGTPTAKALAAAYNYYTAGDGTLLPPGERYVLLATDGGPNCATGLTCESATCTADMDRQSTCGTTITNCCQQTYANAGGGPTLCLDDQGVLDQINALSDAGIKTFVVGIPGTENYKAYLKAFAEAGGAPDPNNPDVGYYAVNEADGVAGLTQTFKGITESLVRSCDVKLAQAPQYTDQLNVAVECVPLAQTDGTIVNWEYNNDLANPMITIKGATCDTIENQGVTRVDVIEGCKKFVIQ